MQYITFNNGEENAHYRYAFVCKTLYKQQLLECYVNHLPESDPKNTAIAYCMGTDPGKSADKNISKALFNKLYPELVSLEIEKRNIEILFVTDATLFKFITGQTKAETRVGYVDVCKFSGLPVIYLPSTKTFYVAYDKAEDFRQRGYSAAASYLNGTYEELGKNIIKHADYLCDVGEIAKFLEILKTHEGDIGADIEGYSLNHVDCGVATIAFATDVEGGFAIVCDRKENGVIVPNWPVRKLLADFFETRDTSKNRIVFHKITFDTTVLIHHLWMDDVFDPEGALRGMEAIFRDGAWDCTHMISYLALNSCSGNMLSLKVLAQEFAGDYAQEDIKDITKIPLRDLLEYNLVDSMSTLFVKNKYFDKMVADNQLNVYENLFKPSAVDIVQMQLSGMPIDLNRVQEVTKILSDVQKNALQKFMQHAGVKAAEKRIAIEKCIKHNAKLVTQKAIKTYDHFLEPFNPNSGAQKAILFHEVFKLPILEYTPSGQASTSKDTMTDLVNHTDDPQVKEILKAFIEYDDVNKMITSFLPAMAKAKYSKRADWHFLFGSYHIGGTVSGRLSSSDPNLQNLPSKSSYAYLIKECFKAPKGWLFVGIDADALEDKISALTTKDVNKLKVYIDGYDGHCLRAHAYYPEDMPDILNDSVDQINRIKEIYPELRNDSKGPTFALTYQGTWKTLVNKAGMSPEKAKLTEQRFKTLYKQSIDWVREKLNQAAIDGYITGAFGLRIRTPLLKQFRGQKPSAAVLAEERTAGNALGQSWCLLNNRAGNEVNAKIRASCFKHTILPVCQIHDAQYFLIRNDVEELYFLNIHLVKAMSWQDHPDIAHDQVKLSGTMSLFYPNWTHDIQIPNNASRDEIIETFEKAMEKWKNK